MKGLTENVKNIFLKSLRRTLTKSGSQYKFAPLQGANPDSRGGEPDHDKPPDGEAEGQPDRHRVDHYAEIDVEEEEDGPAHRKLTMRKL